MRNIHSVLPFIGINCATERELPYGVVIKTNCEEGGLSTTVKIFVRGFRNLHDYIVQLQSGVVSRYQFFALWSYLLQEADASQRVLTNHNLDLAILHFKLIRTSS